MSVLTTCITVIPTHNFLTGCARLTSWLLANEAHFSERNRILIVNDHSERHYEPVFAELAKVATVINTPVDNRRQLKYALRTAAEIAIDDNFQAVLVCESDAILNEQTLHKMANAFLDPPWGRESLASVSPVYCFDQEICYPTHPNWFKLGTGNCYEMMSSEEFGDVSKSDAVPFLCSMWMPECLAQIKDEFPNLVRLDGTLGNYLTQSGYYHLRLLNYYVGHDGGGRKSRRPLDIAADFDQAQLMVANLSESINLRA